jgi:hypothetical protein
MGHIVWQHNSLIINITLFAKQVPPVRCSVDHARKPCQTISELVQLADLRWFILSQNFNKKILNNIWWVKVYDLSSCSKLKKSILWEQEI